MPSVFFFFFFFCTGGQFLIPSWRKKKPTFWEYWSTEPTFPSCLYGVGGLRSTASFPSWVGLHDKLIHHLRFLGASRQENWSHGISAYWEPAGAPSAPFKHCLCSFFRLLGGKDHRPRCPPQENTSGTAPRWRQSPTASSLERLGRGRRSSCALTSRRRSATPAPPRSPRVRFPAGAWRPWCRWS